MQYSHQNSNSRGQPVRFGPHVDGNQYPTPLSGGSMGEGPLRVTPQRPGQPYPSS